MTMLKSLTFAAIVATAIVAFDTAPANASWQNGTSFNGASAGFGNGVNFNGMPINGPSYQGLNFNGNWANGAGLTGLDAPFNGQVIGIEFPTPTATAR
jgi:hypothetical protein